MPKKGTYSFKDIAGNITRMPNEPRKAWRLRVLQDLRAANKEAAM